MAKLDTPITATIRTNFTPEFSFNPLQKVAPAPGLRSALMRLVQPSIDVDLPIVGRTHYAPYGEPTGWGIFAFAIVLFLALYGAFRLLK